MAAADIAITLAAVLKWEAPDGAVRLADGGVVKFDPGGGEESFDCEHPLYGAIYAYDAFDTGVGDMVEGGMIAFAPATGAPLSDWWRTDLENTRLRLWMGEIETDGVSLTGEERLADWLVDTASREQDAAGRDILSIEFMSRLQKMFETQQGNVCSDPFHQSIWPGERGFENCHDGPQYFAWGTEDPGGGRGGNSYGTGGSGTGVGTRSTGNLYEY